MCCQYNETKWAYITKGISFFYCNIVSKVIVFNDTVSC
jgi:hypothetical protein